MKSISFFFLGLIVISLLACKKVNKREMIVIKDCTGSYLSFYDKDYKICNIETVSDFEDGTIVTASYKEIKDCSNLSATGLCTLYHKNEGWIDVIKIENN